MRPTDPLDWIEQHYSVHQLVLSWSSKQGTVTGENIDRITCEWLRCVLRQLLMLRTPACEFDDPHWMKYVDGLMITHSGLLVDPTLGTAIWREPGAPKPSNDRLLPGLRQTGRTYDAAKRYSQEKEGPKTFARTWPPEGIRVPPELYKLTKSTPRELCFVCQHPGHRGLDCDWLVAVYMETAVGSQALADSDVEVPEDLAHTLRHHRRYLRYVLQYEWPLPEAIVWARKLMTNEIHEDKMSDLGSYWERRKIFEELGGNPAMRDWTFVQLVNCATREETQ